MVELKGDFFNKEEVRTHDSRLSYINTFLPKLVETAKQKTLGFKDHLVSIDPNEVGCVEDLQKIIKDNNSIINRTWMKIY